MRRFNAGIEPLKYRLTYVDEDVVIAALGPDAVPGVVVTCCGKSRAGRDPCWPERNIGADCGLACDSILSKGELLGNQHRNRRGAQAVASWRAETGQLLYEPRCYQLQDNKTIVLVTAETTITWYIPRHADLRSGGLPQPSESRCGLGGFTLDGLGGWFIDGVQEQSVRCDRLEPAVAAVARAAMPNPSPHCGQEMRAAQRTAASGFELGQVASGELDDVPLPADPSPTLSAYAHRRLVAADWLAHADAPGLAIVESA